MTAHPLWDSAPSAKKLSAGSAWAWTRLASCAARAWRGASCWDSSTARAPASVAGRSFTSAWGSTRGRAPQDRQGRGSDRQHRGRWDCDWRAGVRPGHPWGRVSRDPSGRGRGSRRRRSFGRRPGGRSRRGRRRRVGFVYAIGGGAIGPAIIDGRRCDPAALEFVQAVARLCRAPTELPVGPK